MLKPSGEGPQGGNERSFGELASQLIDDGKAYARAEVDLAKSIAADKTKTIRISAIFLAAAAVVAMGAFNALCFGIFVGLAMLMNPVLAGIVAFVLIGAIAALLAWFGVSKLRESL